MWKSRLKVKERLRKVSILKNFVQTIFFPFDLGTYISNDYAIKRDITMVCQYFYIPRLTWMI